MARKSENNTEAGTFPGIKRNSRKRYSSEEKSHIGLEAPQVGETVVALCSREGIRVSVCYRWREAFLDAGIQRLLRNTDRQARLAFNIHASVDVRVSAGGIN